MRAERQLSLPGRQAKVTPRSDSLRFTPGCMPESASTHRRRPARRASKSPLVRAAGIRRAFSRCIGPAIEQDPKGATMIRSLGIALATVFAVAGVARAAEPAPSKIEEVRDHRTPAKVRDHRQVPKVTDDRKAP